MWVTMRWFAVTFIALPILAGVTGVLASFAAVWILSFAFWLPFWRQLRDSGMYVDDIEISYMLWLGPPAVAIMFAAAALLALATAQLTQREKAQAVIIRTVLLFPGIVTFVALNPFVLHGTLQGRMWRYPFAETAVLLTGVFIGQMLIWLSRMSKEQWSLAKAGLPA